MDFFSQATTDFYKLPCLDSWEDARRIFRSAASGKPNHWLLPIRSCEAVGGKPEQAIPAVLAVACAHISILLVDDMLDSDPRGEYHRIGAPTTADLACAFQAAALESAIHIAGNTSVLNSALTCLNRMFLVTAFGQILDIQARMDETAYWKTARAKSSPFFGVALQIGALAGGGSVEVAESLRTLGQRYGEMIQIQDDMHDSMESPANPDWIQGRYPLPILFASIVEHPKKERFLKLNRNISDHDTLQEAQEILIQCGAISYCVDQLIRSHEQSEELMNRIPLVNPTPLISLLDEVIAPVHELLKAGGL